MHLGKEHLQSGADPADVQQGQGWRALFVQDLHYGFRILRKNRIYALVSILTLTLGIGASTAIFSVVHGVLLRSLPYYKAEQIVLLWEVNPEGHHKRFSDPDFEDMRAQTRSLEGMAEMASYETSVSVGDEPDRVRVADVSKDFFSVMGVKPAIGRLFSAEEQHFGAATTVLVSYSYWQHHLQQARELGTVKFTIARRPAVIIGVLPQGFSFPDDSQIWTARETGLSLTSRSAHNWEVVARLREGTSLNQARADVSATAHRLYEQYHSADMTMVNTAILPLQEALMADVRPALLILLGVAGLLLLVACANVMNLSLAQASSRTSELAIRAALGASRGVLVRQFLAEALLLCFVSGCLGVTAAYFGVRVLLVLAPDNIPRLNEISMNLPVLLFALGLSLLVAASLGVLTAWRATSGDVQSALIEAGRRQGTTSRSQRTGRILAAGQVAITVTLLIGAGLLARSMLHVLSVQPGFQIDHILALDLRLPGLKPELEAQRVQFLDQLASRVHSLPGVQSVGGTDTLPLVPNTVNGIFTEINPQQLTPAQHALIDRSAHTYIESSDAAFQNDFSGFVKELISNRAHTGDADYIVASEGYFETLGIPLLKGRLFNSSDGPDAPHVAVISGSVAQEKWPDQDPIGHTIEFGNMDGDLRLLTIVGVVGEIRRQSLEVAPRPTVYVNYRQRPRTSSQFAIVLRTSADPQGVFASARNILRQLDPDVPVRFTTFNQILAESLNTRRFNLLLVGVFAVAALILAMAGVFGVLAYSVAQRTREIGLRMALGATKKSVLRMILGQGLTTTLAGTAVGFVGAFLLTRTMRSLLFEVSPTDPVTLLVVPLSLAVLAVLASYIPARRATGVDPMVALHSE